MAQTYSPGTDPDPAEETEPKKSGFHYYSGGEVKELEHTKVSPALWAFWSVVILGALGYLIWGGALGPNSPLGGFKPTGGSANSQAMIQTDINQRARGGSLQAADMSHLQPFLGSETLTTAITNGSNTYQNYCIGCHGPNQDGNGVGAASLNPKPRNLHDAPFMRETLTYDRINHSLHYGVHGTAMPPWENTLSEHQIQEVIAYALSLTWTLPSDTTNTAQPANAAPATPAPANTSPANTSPANTSPANTAPAISTSAGTSSAAPKSTDKAKNPALVGPRPAGQNAGLAGPGKSVTGSATGTAGGVMVRGGSVMSSPAPITPTIDGNPTADTSTAPPSLSGSTAPKHDAPIVR